MTLHAPPQALPASLWRVPALLLPAAALLAWWFLAPPAWQAADDAVLILGTPLICVVLRLTAGRHPDQPVGTPVWPADLAIGAGAFVATAAFWATAWPPPEREMGLGAVGLAIVKFGAFLLCFWWPGLLTAALGHALEAAAGRPAGPGACRRRLRAGFLGAALAAGVLLCTGRLALLWAGDGAI